MYLPLQPLLNQEASVADLLVAALTSAEDVSKLLPAADPILPVLQQVRQADSLFLDLCDADSQLTEEEREKIVRTISDHWHQHGWCIARSSDPHRWLQAVFDSQQPLLHWRSLSILHGWELIGPQLRGTELEIFRLLAARGATTVEQVATNSTLFSQQPNFGSPSVQMDIAMGRIPRGPIDHNRSEARIVLTRMRNRRIVIERGGFYGIVRPTRDHAV